MTQTAVPHPTEPDIGEPPDPPETGLLGRITRLELVVGALVAAVMAVLVLVEPDILAAPFQNGRTVLFTFGGTAVAAAVLLAMLRFGVPAPVRIVVLLVPFVAVNWWLLSPYFVDDVVDEEFSTSITEQLDTTDQAEVADEAGADSGDERAVDAPSTTDAPPAPASGPVLLGAGQFVGLAGHSGTGDAGIFENPDGSLVLRFENFDIENGPDLEVYLVPGADQTDLVEGSIHLGALAGNVGDQTYELPPGTELPPGEYTALVWCDAFAIEFVGATITV